MRNSDFWNDPGNVQPNFQRVEDQMRDMRDDHERRALEISDLIQRTCNTRLDKIMERKKGKTPFDGSAPRSVNAKPK